MARNDREATKSLRKRKKGEAKAEQWLKQHGFKIPECFTGKSQEGYFDIKARKGKSDGSLRSRLEKAPDRHKEY